MEGLEGLEPDAQRLRVLERYHIVGSEPEPAFDRLVELAAHVASTPTAFISVVDGSRSWFKARYGSDLLALPREVAMGPITMLSNGPMVVTDASRDPKFKNHPLVVGEPFAQAYAGVPIRSREGFPLGAVSTIDTRAREFSPQQLRGLELIAEQVQHLLEDRRIEFERIADSSEPALLFGADWRLRFANTRGLELLNVSDAASGSPLAELLPPEVAQELVRRATEGVRHPLKMRVSERKLSASVHASSLGFVVALRDVTASSAQAARHAQERELWLSLIDGSQDAIFTKDLMGRYTLINDAGARELGHPRSEVLGHTDHELLPVELAGPRVARDLAVIGAGRTVTYEDTELRGGQPRTWLVNEGVLRDRTAQILGIFGIARDITDRKRVERELEVGEERLRVAMSAGRLGAWDWDMAGRKLSLSGFSREVLGVPPVVDIEGSELESLVLAEDRPQLRAALRGAVRHASKVEVDFRVRRIDGSLRWLHAGGRPLADLHGRVARIVGVLSDVTAQKEQEARAQQISRFQEQLLGIVSHDLRNPLSAIRIWVANLSSEATSPRARRATERIVNSVVRMERMISDLLDFTRARLGGGLPLLPADVDLAEICADVLDELGATHPGRLNLETHGAVRGLWDGSRLAQVISNLVGNALVHSPAESRVEVAVRAEGENEVELRVQNGGPPISADLLPILFEPFRRGADSTRKSANLGLGLYITREVVEAHGGNISVSSGVQGMTTFSVRLPRQIR